MTVWMTMAFPLLRFMPAVTPHRFINIQERDT
jgi:hypothetical protein